MTRAVRECGRFQWRSDLPDAATLIGRIVTATVANLGSIDALPARSVGSRESHLVRELVETTVSGGELLNWRSEALHLYVDPREIFESFGLDKVRDVDLNAASAHIVEEIEMLYFDDEEAYVEAYARTVAEIVSEQDITIPVRVHKGDRDELSGGYNSGNDGTADLHRLARARTPLPQLERAPGDVEGSMPDAVRAAGRTYAERASQAQHGGRA